MCIRDSYRTVVHRFQRDFLEQQICMGTIDSLPGDLDNPKRRFNSDIFPSIQALNFFDVFSLMLISPVSFAYSMLSLPAYPPAATVVLLFIYLQSIVNLSRANLFRYFELCFSGSISILTNNAPYLYIKRAGVSPA